ncbi:hypothetical protein TNIN_94811 [Trichonephila inaurata madagascariensis]|uniref:Uncharacterized protein n=1 Tax=Trichonephila inaurata madagascariensis TaxID=2747483 RepID=A0A8X6WZP1_9ARAC|nr:hypothetical protein TNIN_94811 [Trichonephila inaurata madagascariensis]
MEEPIFHGLFDPRAADATRLVLSTGGLCSKFVYGPNFKSLAYREVSLKSITEFPPDRQESELMKGLGMLWPLFDPRANKLNT